MRETSRDPESSGEPLTPEAKKRLLQALQLASDQAHGNEAELRKGLAAAFDEVIKKYPDRPDALLELGLQIHSGDLFEENALMIYFSEAIKALTRLDPDKAWKFSREMGGGDVLRFEPTQAVFSQLVESRGFAGAVDYIRSQVPGAMTIEIASYLLPETNLTPEMASGALAALDKADVTEEHFEFHLGNLSQRLVVSDLNAFSSWVDRQPRDDRYANAYEEVAKTLAGKNEVENAAGWVRRIQDPEKRERARQSALSSAQIARLFSLDQMPSEEAEKILGKEE